MADATIRLVTRRADDMAEFAVADAGSGFPEELMARVFEPYVTTKSGGTGSAWRSSRRLLTNTAGRSASTIAPRGAEVSILLPLWCHVRRKFKTATHYRKRTEHGANTGRR